MRKYVAITAIVAILSMCGKSHGLMGEHIGPKAGFPTMGQPDWPKGIVEIPNHESRVYSVWRGTINENFYFKCTVDEINELLDIFATARMRDHVVRIQPGVKKAVSFRSKEEIEYNVHLQIVSGGTQFSVGEEMRNDLPVEPRLTIVTGDDNGAFVKLIKWPENVIVESDIPGVSINRDNAKPKRNVYYALCEFADGSPAVDFVMGSNSWITLWEQDEPDGILIGRITHKGYCRLLLSAAELADLKRGSTWLTISVGNWLVTPYRTDMRLPAEMLTKDKEQARPIKVRPPSYYYGRLLFEDGSPPVLDPPPWPGAKIMVSFPYGGPANPDSQGYFKLSFTPEQFEQLLKRKDEKNIYIPDLIERGRSRAEFTFPANLLSTGKTTAGVVKIPRPKLPRKELATAESKIGKPIPGFADVRFDVFDKDQIDGKPLLICFWDMEQRPSRQYIRVLEKHKRALQDSDIVVLAVHCGAKQAKQVADWLDKNAPSLTAGTIEADPYDTLLAWGARGMPWVVLTNERHIITNEGIDPAGLPEVK